jgi:hypothetical protein
MGFVPRTRLESDAAVAQGEHRLAASIEQGARHIGIEAEAAHRDGHGAADNAVCIVGLYERGFDVILVA